MSLPDGLRALRIRNYRLYASGQLMTLTGRWMLLTGMDWLVVQLGGGGTELGIATALQFAPTLVLGLWAGVLADRVDKRRLLLLTQGGFGLLAGIGTLLLATGAMTLPAVFALAAAFGVVVALDTPARQSFVVEMVGPDDLTNAVALNSMTFNSARIVGPSIAGLLITAAGTTPVFGLATASAVGVLTGLVRMRVAELHPSQPIVRAKGQLLEGISYVRGRSDLVLVFALVAVIAALGLNFVVTLALMARQQFHGGAELYGAFSSMLAVGSLAGAFGATRRGRPRQRTLVASAAAFGAAESLAAVMPTPLTFSIALVVTGAALLTFTTTANTMVQISVDSQMRGRVMAIYLLIFLGSTPVGGPLVGALSSAFGPRAGLLVGGLPSLAAAAVAGWVLLRHRPSIPALGPGELAIAA